MPLTVTLLEEEALWIGHDVRVILGRTSNAGRGRRVTIQAPPEVTVLREELGRPPEPGIKELATGLFNRLSENKVALGPVEIRLLHQLKEFIQ